MWVCGLVGGRVGGSIAGWLAGMGDRGREHEAVEKGDGRWEVDGGAREEGVGTGGAW